MNGFDEALKVEERGKRRLAPWFDHVAHDGRWVWNAKGAMAEILQREFDVDTMISVGPFESLGLELKFLAVSNEAPFETYSNFVPMFDGTPDRAKSTRGWGWTCQADLIAIYCLSDDAGVVGRLPAWRTLLNEKLESGLRRWELYAKRAQLKHQQPNCTHIIWTPYSDLVRHAGFVRFSASQLELLDQGNPIQRAAQRRPPLADAAE